MAPQLDQSSKRRPQAVFFFSPPCFFFFVFFYLLPGPLSLFTLLFRDASVLTPEVRGHWSTGAIPLLLPTALSL